MLVITMFRVLVARMTALAVDESGMSTVEYAIGTIAAAAFGAILYTVVTGDSIVSALNRIIGTTGASGHLIVGQHRSP